MGIDSEYKKLKEVLLYKPGPEIEDIDNPEDVLYVKKIKYAGIHEEYEHLLALYRSLNINIHMIDPAGLDFEDKRYLFNMMYTRDLLFMTPEGAIVAKMGTDIRKNEIRFAEKALRDFNIPVIDKIDRDNTFEGADAVWVNRNLVLIGVGNRTNHGGFLHVRDVLKDIGIDCEPVPAPKSVVHLLGAVQLVDTYLALVRTASVCEKVIGLLKENQIDIVEIPENDEVRNKHSLNIVTVAPREVIMSENCPDTKKIFESCGIGIVAELMTEQLINGGGGIACATGILSREC